MKAKILFVVLVIFLASAGIARACEMMEGHDDQINGTEESCDMDMIGKEMGRGMAYNIMGMMNGGMWNSNYYAQFNLFGVLYLILLIGLTILVYLWIIKLWRELNKK